MRLFTWTFRTSGHANALHINVRGTGKFQFCIVIANRRDTLFMDEMSWRVDFASTETAE